MQRFESKNPFGFSATGLSKLAFRVRKLSGAFEKRAPVSFFRPQTSQLLHNYDDDIFHLPAV